MSINVFLSDIQVLLVLIFMRFLEVLKILLMHFIHLTFMVLVSFLCLAIYFPCFFVFVIEEFTLMLVLLIRILLTWKTKINMNCILFGIDSSLFGMLPTFNLRLALEGSLPQITTLAKWKCCCVWTVSGFIDYQ